MFAAISQRIRRWFTPPTLGQRGERAAVRFLKRLGYVIVAESSRDKTGEIDIVAVDGRTIVFVEVKTRTSHIAGHPADAVDTDKQQRLSRLALRYLRRHDLLEKRWRFDIIAVTWPDEKRRPLIEHFINAFESADQGQMFS
jgi:putative endonuclease